MDFMASNSYRSACRRPWQKSMDSQEFGFASNLINSMEVAPADELFFKGQLLPLQMDPRQHLVQALSCDEQGSYSRGGLSRISYWCQNEEIIEYNSCWIGNEDHALSCKALNSLVGHASNSIVHHCPLLEQAPSKFCEQGLERELSMCSWCKDKEFHSCRMEGDMGLDHNINKASIKDHKPYLAQQPPRICDQDPRGGSSLSISCKDVQIKGPWLSNWSKDEEISFNSCRMEGDVDVIDRMRNNNTLMDLRSSSFRSQNSGFWESGADKDTGDSSSSSRDSNGSSQDSYFPNNTKLETPSLITTPHYPHTKASFNIPWKSLLKKASKKHNYSSSPSISRMGYSEDLSKYREYSASSLKEAKEAILPWKLDCVANEQRSTYNQEKKGKGKSKSKGTSNSSNDRSISGLKSKSALCDEAKEVDANPNKSTATSSKSLISKGKGGRDHENEEMKRTQSRSAVPMKERWQGYARRLRPLYEMKKGLMGQFRMDECGKRACEVESSNIYAARTAPILQRRLSHQSSLFERHKLIIQEKNQGNLHPHKGRNMLAMSSCPTSTRSSPNHSGVLAVIDVKHKCASTAAAATTTTTLQLAHCTGKTMNTSVNISKDHASTNKISSNKNIKASSTNVLPSTSNYSSMSTMHELHSALQSAIAHCKESNKRLDCLA